MPTSTIPFATIVCATLITLASCSSDGGPSTGDARYVLASVVISPEGRTTYVQTLASLDATHVTNENAIEVPGNGTFLARGANIFVGLVEEPTWVRYTVGSDGAFAETGRISFQSYGAASIDYGNAIVDDDTAVSVISGQRLAIIWNPETMSVLRTIPLPHLDIEGYDLEVWTTTAYDGRVYVPGRYANWDLGLIRNGVSLTILDPDAGTIVGIAEDDRCASGGRVVFDAEGYGYVMGDGRTYSAQMFARAASQPVPENCLLRIAPGATDFEEDFFYTVPDLTGGLESITELHTADDGSGVAFAKMFYESELPDGVEPTTWAFWDMPAMKMWRIVLGDVPTAVEVSGVPFGAVGFTGAAMGGHVFSGETALDGTTTVYDIDPATNTGAPRFTMDGYFYGLHAIAD